MWVFFARKILRNRIPILIALGLLTLFMGYQATQVGLSYEYAALLPKEDSAYIDYQNFKAKFGEDASAMIVGIQDPDFFDLQHFQSFYDLNDSIRAVDGVVGVASVTGTYYLKKNPAKKNFEMLKFFEYRPNTQVELDNIADTVLRSQFYDRLMFNKQSNVYLLFISLEKAKLDSKLREKIVDNIVGHISAHTDRFEIKAHYSGLPYIRTRTSVKLKNELMMFIALAALITSFILFLFFRSLKTVLFCMTVVSVGVVWVFGWMGVFDFKVTILTALIPPLIIVIGVPNSIFLLNKYHSEYKKHGNKIKALQRVIYKIGNATFLTNLTTASGFATFIITSSNILKEFGLVAFLGIMGVFLFSILLIPIIFSLLGPPSEKHTKHLENGFVNQFVNKLVHATVHYRRTLYVVSAGILVVGVIGVSIIKSTGYMVDDLPHHDPIYMDLKFLEKNFNGVMPLEIEINTQKKKGAVQVKAIKKIEEMADSLAKYNEISRALSLSDFVKFARQSYYNGNFKYYSMPNSFDRNFIMSYILKTKGSQQNALLDSNMQVTRITATVQDIGTEKMQKLEERILADVDSVFGGTNYDVNVTGASIVFFKGAKYLIKNLFQSLLLAVVLIAIFMAWMFKSWRMVFIALVPNLFPLILTASLMGYFGIPIKPSTILVFSIAFGISVDDTIHFLAKYRQELALSKWNIGVSVVTALKETGVSMIYTSIVLFFGFSIFVASEFGGTVALGALVSFTLLVAMVSNLLLLPALLLSLEKFITTRSFKEPAIEIYDEDEENEDDPFADDEDN